MIDLFETAVNITEGNNATIFIHLINVMPAEREVPVMLGIMLRSAFSSMYMPLLYYHLPHNNINIIIMKCNR